MQRLLAAGLLALCACTATPDTDPIVANSFNDERTASVDAILDALYESFSFGPGEEDWTLLRSLCIEDAVFLQPLGSSPRHEVIGIDPFIRDFEDFIAASDAKTLGFHEEITHRRIDLFGNVAHAWVVFEGRFAKDGPIRSRGLDSIQLVRHQGRWWVVSFTTHFESPGDPMPGRFLRDEGRSIESAGR